MQLCTEVERELKLIISEVTSWKYQNIRSHIQRALDSVTEFRRHLAQEPAAVFSAEEILRTLLRACETQNPKVVLPCLKLIQVMIEREAVLSEGLSLIVNLLKEQAAYSDDERIHTQVLLILQRVCGVRKLDAFVVELVFQVGVFPRTDHAGPRQYQGVLL